MTAPSARVATPGTITLTGGTARVEVVPAHGGRIRSLHLGGREWLLQGLPDDAPEAGRSPFAGAGWDECAPALGGGVLPDWVKGVGGRPVPAGGEARLQVPAIALRTAPEGHQLTCTWRGDRLPWTLTRTILVRPDGTVDVRYEALATGTQRLPFLWSALWLLPLAAGTRLRFPEATRLRVDAVDGAQAAVTASGTAAQWPRLSLDGRLRDLSVPWQLPRGACVRAWLDLAGARASFAVRQDAAELSVTADGDGVPHCGLVLDRGGIRDGRRRGLLGGAAPPAVAIIPSLGAPERYADALGEWQAVSWLAPGEPRRWSLTLRAGG